MLRRLAARAENKSVWPRLRHYAESQTTPEQRGWAHFVLGYREFEAGDYVAAATDLREAATNKFPLADYATYYAALAADKTNSPNQVAESLHGFSSSFPDSPLRLQALELLASSLIDSQKLQEAAQILLDEPGVRRKPSLCLLLAKAYQQQGNLQQAVSAFQDVYFAFPATTQAKEAGEALDHLGSTLGAAFPQTTEEVETGRARLLFKASAYQEAMKAYEELLSSHPASGLADSWRLGRARCLVHLRHNSEAIEALSASLGSPAANAERLALLVEVHARQDESADILQCLSQIQAIDAHSPFYEDALNSAGNSYFELGDWRNAGLQYQTLVESFPQGEHAHDVNWRRIWCLYLAGDHPGARQALQGFLTSYPGSPRGAAALYWLGRLDEEQGEIAEARMLYSFLRNRFAHSFYAEQAGLREKQLPRASAAELPQHGPGDLEFTRNIPRREPSPIPPCLPNPTVESLGPASALTALSMEGMAAQYLKASLAEKPAQPELRLFLSQIEAGQDKASVALFEALTVAPDYTSHEFSELPRELWDLLYPRSYWKLVQRYARANKLDPYLVMGLIRQESGFNPGATSPADAHGLMQILPTTASSSKRPSRIRATGVRLYNPAYNIRFGCAYLRSLLKAFDGQPEMAVAAYNAGDFRVRDWLKGNSFRDSSEFLEAIPIRATRTYVESVLRDAAIYRRLMTGSAKFAGCGKYPKHVKEIGLAVVPGSSFYSNPSLGAQQVRFAFCKTDATLDEAARRLTR